MNRLTQATEEIAGIPIGNYSYEANGNLTSQTNGANVTNYEYDVRDQLRRVTNGASELGRYDYDAERRRLTRSTAGGALLYVYDGAEVVEESGWDAAAQRTTLLNRYEHGLEMVKANLAGEGERYYFSEGQGSVTMLATAGNAVAQRTEYEAWGEVLSQTNSSVNAVGYTGARRDIETGLLALGNGERFYNPALGRFIQQDRWSGMAGLAQTLNRYAYGVNNPVRWTDHSGNSPDGMSASDATRIGGGESSAGEFRADSQLVDDSWARGMAQQNAGRSYEENASEVPFTQVMREQTQARMFEAQVVIAHTVVNTAFGIASPMLKNPLAQAFAGRAEEFIHQKIDFEMGVEGAQPPSIRDLVVGTAKDLVTDFLIGKTIEHAAKGVGKVAEKVKEKVRGKAIGAAESAVRQETRSLTGGGKGNGSGGSEHGNGGGGSGGGKKTRFSGDADGNVKDLETGRGNQNTIGRQGKIEGQSARTPLIDLEAEEKLGGHSIDRHGAQLSSSDMEQRVLGTHPTLPQSRSALKFDSEEIHSESVNQAFSHHQADIEAHFKAGGGYGKWTYDYGSKVGEGFTNIGTRSNPISQQVTTTKVTIAFHPDSSNPRGYRLDSAYPEF